MKTCSKCHIEKTFNEFPPRLSAPDGLKGQCRECLNTIERNRQRKKRRDNPPTDKICLTCTESLPLENFQEYRNNHGSLSYQNHCKECQISGKTSERASVLHEGKKLCVECGLLLPMNQFYPTTRGLGGCQAYCLSCVKTRSVDVYAQNKPRHKEQSYRWREENRERYLAQHRIHQFNRRSQTKVSSDGTVTPEFCIAIYETEICTYCKKLTPLTFRTMDHVVALSNGGLHSASNIVMACFSCNSSKRESLLEDWIKTLE